MSSESGPTKPFVRTIVLDDGNSPSALNAALNAATCSAENLERILSHDVASPPLIDLSDSMPFRGVSDIESGRNRGIGDTASNRLSFNVPSAPEETRPENARMVAPTPMERRGDDAGQERNSEFQNQESESVPWSLRHNSEAANDLANAIWTRLSSRSHDGAGMDRTNFINDDNMSHSPTSQGRENVATEQGGMRHDSVPPDMRKNSEVAAELANRVREAFFAKR